MKRSTPTLYEAAQHMIADAEDIDLDAALAKYWPGNLPEFERRLWDKFPTEVKRQAVRRLRALAMRAPLPAGGKGKKVRASEAAIVAGTAVSTLYAFERNFRANPSILSLGLNKQAPKQKSKPGKNTSKLGSHIKRLLIEDPWQNAPSLFAALKRDQPKNQKISFTTMLRLLRQIRPSVPRNATFGRHIVFDSAGMDIVDCDGQRLRLCALIDAETMLVLGWDVAPDHSEIHGYGMAASHALNGPVHPHEQSLAFARPALVDAPIEPQTVTMYFAESDDLPTVSWPSNGPKLEIIKSPKLGSALIDILGDRVGDIWIGSGRRTSSDSYRTSRPVLMAEANSTTLSAIGTDILSHNNTIHSAQGNAPPIEMLHTFLAKMLDSISANRPAGPQLAPMRAKMT